jgi:signal transduction histidine kinase
LKVKLPRFKKKEQKVAQRRIQIFRPLLILWEFITDELYVYIQTRISQSLRLQLILVFGICLLASSLVTTMSNPFFGRMNQEVYIDYRLGKNQIDENARMIAEKIMSMDSSAVKPSAEDLPLEEKQKDSGSEIDAKSINNNPTVNQLTLGEEELSRYINRTAEDLQCKILLVNYDGKVLLKSQSASEIQVDIHSIIQNAMNTRIMQSSDEGKEFISFYPFKNQVLEGYVIVSGNPKANIAYRQGSDPFPAVVLGFITFILLFLLLTRRKMRYFEQLTSGVLEISKGNLKFRVAEKYQDELGSLARNINHMGKELEERIELERRAERTKNELITNVSHDLRTPLTSIMGYLRLLIDKKYETKEDVDNFLNIAYGKSEKLKGLIEDLFEYTRLTDQEIKLNFQQVSQHELIEQLLDELSPIAESDQICFETEFPQGKVWALMDSDKMVRVYENLLINAINYSYKPGIIKVSLIENENNVIVCIKNIGAEIPKEDLPYIFDRFYRVEKSRSSSCGGAGLGLAISKQIVELHNGKIWAESEENNTYFYVCLNKLSK